MKAKLHKMVSGYILSLNGDIDDPYAIVNEELAKDHEWYKLSLKNCEAIANGYDLDELAMGYDLYENINFVGQMRAFKAGFQKALELMSDKKFSEDDMRKAYREGYYDEHSIKVVIQSLQQTEWDVEVVMTKEEYTWSPRGEGFEDQTYRDWREVPKLDADGCLILKICQ